MWGWVVFITISIAVFVNLVYTRGTKMLLLIIPTMVCETVFVLSVYVLNEQFLLPLPITPQILISSTFVSSFLAICGTAICLGFLLKADIDQSIYGLKPSNGICPECGRQTDSNDVCQNCDYA